MTKHWYGLIVPPQKEFAAEQILKKRGYKPFVPVETKLRRLNRYQKGKVAVPVPMWRGYVFIACYVAPFWHDLFKLDVISDVVRMDEEPYEIGDHEMQEAIRLSGKHLPHILSPNTTASFCVGDRVRVDDVAFAGQESCVEQIESNAAHLTLEFFGTPRRVKVSLDKLSAA